MNNCRESFGQKYGYPLMLAPVTPVDGGMSCSTNSIHYGNFSQSHNTSVPCNRSNTANRISSLPMEKLCGASCQYSTRQSFSVIPERPQKQSIAKRLAYLAQGRCSHSKTPLITAEATQSRQVRQLVSRKSNLRLRTRSALVVFEYLKFSGG
ncbi:hypothetical protein NSTC731_00276 [Nostoc sp. DSM 114167]|jgi:hypothetical protein